MLALAEVPAHAEPAATDDALSINDQEYLEMTGLNVMLAHDYYPEGHQGGVGIIQNGQRIATNGDVRLEPTPGQWQPTPVVGKRQVDRAAQQISVRMSFPDEAQDRRGLNPIGYPDLKMGYVLRVKPAGRAFRIIVDFDQPVPAAWVGKVGFNLELYPGILFGKSYEIGGQSGIFPRQANGPGAVSDGDYEVAPLGHGSKLMVAPETDRQRMTIEVVRGGEIELLDGRAQHNNGWFVARSLAPAGATADAIEWLVTPHAIPGWKSDPVIQVSQVGYHPRQTKVAVIELDRHETEFKDVALYRVTDGGLERVAERPATHWGRFLRYHYLQFDFTDIVRPGMYAVGYGDQRSNVFQIDEHVFQRNVWQPTVEYFLPVQMAHMRVNDHYRVWHGLSHMDDALMAPVNHNHFDGYVQGPSTLTKYQPGEHVPGLDRGGWYDAGDHDFRIESQADTVHGLALAWELFHPTLDNTTIDQDAHIVEIHCPDGKPDVLQQIEHGVLSIVGGYNSLGRLYRGIQDASLHQYTFLGDAADMTDNLVFHDTAASWTCRERWPPRRGRSRDSMTRSRATACASRRSSGKAPRRRIPHCTGWRPPSSSTRPRARRNTPSSSSAWATRSCRGSTRSDGSAPGPLRSSMTPTSPRRSGPPCESTARRSTPSRRRRPTASPIGPMSGEPAGTSSDSAWSSTSCTWERPTSFPRPT